MAAAGLEAFLGVERSDLESALFLTFGKESKSPFDDPEIVRPSKISNYYSRLGLDNFVDDEVAIKKAYHRQAIIWHPDRNPTYKEEAEGEFKAINEAFQTLNTPASKAKYDKKLREELNADKKPNDWQPAKENAKRASRYARSYVTLEEIDSQLTPQERAKVDYLDSLVDAGEISLKCFGEVYMANMGKKCDYCSETIPTRGATISYRNSSITLPDIFVHSLLAHGARALIAAHLKTLPHWNDRFEMAYYPINHIYQELKINLPNKAIEQAPRS